MMRGRALRAVSLAGALASAAACSRPRMSETPAAEDPRRAAVVRFWALVNEATTLRMAGDLERAARAYEEALSVDPRHEDSLYYLGHCQRELGDAIAARRIFSRLVEVNPASARGHMALAALLVSPEAREPLDLESAEAHLRRAHEINGEETGPMLRLGEVLIVQDRVQEAGTWLEAAARTNPRSVEAAFLAGYLLWEAGDRRGAVACLERAARAGQADAPLKGVLGEGDRKVPAVGSAQVAAPPLRDPMGRTLFGELARPLRNAEAATVAARADQLYGAVREARRALVLRRVEPRHAILASDRVLSR